MLKFLRKIILKVMLLLVLTNCVAFLRPKGQWSESINLGLHNASLKNTKLQVGCGDVNRQGDYRIYEKRFCKYLAKNFQSMGAETLETTNDQGLRDRLGQVDFTVLFLNKGVDYEFCWWSGAAFLMTLTLFPCVTDEYVQAELRIIDHNGVVKDIKPLELQRRRYAGIGALPILTSSDLSNRRDYHQDLNRNFIEYIQNTVYTFHVRQDIY